MTPQATDPSNRRRPRALSVLGLLVVAGLVAPEMAHAYLDPISGSVLLQIAVAGVLASFFGVKRFFAGLADQVRRRLGPRRK